MVARRSIAALCVLCVLVLVGAQAAWAVEPPAVEEEYVSNVSGTSATLQATVNPNSSATTYLFEYGTTSSYSATAPQTEGELAAGAEGAGVSVHIQGLTPETTYHYRVVATGPGGSIDGSDLTFTTESAGGELVLPDGRQWELVSPPDKHGALIEAGRQEGGAIQAAASGGGIAYIASAPVTGEEVGSRSPEPSDVLSERGPGGWSTVDLAPPNNEPTGLKVGFGTEYRAFSSNLSLGVMEAPQDLPLSPEASEWTPYLREDSSAVYRPLVDAANVPPGTEFGGRNAGGGVREGAPMFEGASPDLSHVILGSEVPLTENAVANGLYEWSGGHLELVSVLPGPGKQPTSGALGDSGGGLQNAGRNIHAVSVDGSRAVFASESHLYLRDTTLKQTVQVDVGNKNGSASFMAASADDSKVFFTSSEALTPGAAGYDLYQCEVTVVGGELTCALTDLSQGEGVQGVIGVSEDGAYVYFVDGEEIFLAHAGTTSPVAVLGPHPADYFNDSSGLTARVSPDGRYLAFVSTLSLTGYDNRDVVSGADDTEVYLYDAVSKHLTCASCDPTGERPKGLALTGPESEVPLVNEPDTYGGGVTLSGSVPGWTYVGVGGKALHQSRYLSDSGELFFDSAEALVPQDVNGLEDVYEYEPEGVGGCVRSDGCVSLISSGSSQEESVFLDASESGEDVYFVTGQPLVARDYDHALDVYDAHACSAEAPCVIEPAVPPPCDSGDSCKAAPSPQPEVFGAPPSATFNGQGNVVPASTTTTAKKATPKKKTKSALKTCESKHRHNSHRRQLCMRLVRNAGKGTGARRAAVRQRNVKASRGGSGR